MKRFMAFILAFVMIIGSVASAAPGDIIHTGNKRVYRHDLKVDQQDLVKDILNGLDVGKFYRETKDGKFINIVNEEDAQTNYMTNIMKTHGLTTPEELREYMSKNEDKIKAELEGLTTPIDFDDITDADKGNYEDYFGSSKAPKLKDVNYSSPVPGSVSYTTKILTKLLPTGATNWIIKVGEEEFKDFKIDEVVEGTTPYISGNDIEVKTDQHLLLGAVDAAGKLKAYANINIVASMINVPKVLAEKDENIKATFEPSTKSSGATKVSITSDGTWKVAVINNSTDIIYIDSTFAGSLDYKEDIELVLASDAELDNNLDGFAKKVIIYKENNEGIEKYNIFDINKTLVSTLLDAKGLVIKKDDDNSESYNYSKPVKGDSSGTTKIVELNLPDGASKWMYAFDQTELVKPKLDRVYEGSNPYEAGKEIKVSAGDHLMILATDDGGKVRAYGIVMIDPGMIKDPLADSFTKFEHYSVPEKGTTIGTTKFQHLKYSDKDLYYELSDKSIAIPEKNSDFSKRIPLLTKIEPNSGNTADNIKIFDENASELKNENGFTKYMMIYAIDGNNVLAYQDFVMTPNNVKLPKADKLPWQNYSESESDEPLKPGTISNSTVLKKLDKNNITGAENLKYVYTFVSEDDVQIGINEVVKSIEPLDPGVDLTPAKIGESLLILLVDKNRTKYYSTIKLTEDNTRIGDAPKLVLGRNFSNPEPGTDFGSTRFNLLGFDGFEGATQFMVATSNTPFKTVELNSTIETSVKYATIDTDGKITYHKNEVEGKTKTDANGNILSVDSKTHKYLQLLATDVNEKVKGYLNFTLTENMIRGNKAKPLNTNNYTINKGATPGTIKFSKLSPFGVGNTGWMYKWSPTDEFTANPPFEGQVIADATTVRTKVIDANSSEGIDDIKVEKQTDNHGYILLLATNGNRVAGYTVIPVIEDYVQKTANILTIDLKPGTNPDSTEIKGIDMELAKKYIVSTTPMDPPGPNADLPKTGVKDVPVNKEISVKVGEHLRIFNVDSNNKIIGFKDFTIELGHIKQGTATLEVLSPDGKIGTDYEILEGRVKANAIKIVVKLTGASWADVVNDKTIKDAFLNGFKAAGTEQGEWSKVIQKIKDGKFSISKTGETLTITTTATEDYNISEEQKISLTIPARAIVGAINPIEVLHDKIVIKPTIDAKISGSVVNNIRQSTINSGTATIIIDIVDSKWSDTIEAIENKTKLLDGFKGDGGSDSPWNKSDGLKSKIKIGIENVKLIDPQRISITIPKNEIKIDSPETITLTIDDTLVDGAKSPIIAAPSFTIYPDILPIGGIVDDSKKVILEAPKYLNALQDNDTWIVNLDGNIEFKKDFTVAKDISTSTLPTGLKLEITKVNSKQLSIKLVGKTTKELSKGAINLVIKSSAINEKNYSDSNTIPLEYTRGESINLNGVTYKIENDCIYLEIIDNSIKKQDIMYSINSTTSSNGDWATIPDDFKISGNLEPITISIKETKQPDNFKPLRKLVNPPAPTGIEIDNYDYSSDELVVTLNKSEKLQYNLTTPNDWKDVPPSKQITLPKGSSLIVRDKALPGVGEASSLPSLPTAKLNGLYLGDVRLDVSQSKIIGATRDMKYKLSNDGTWNTITANDPTVSFKDGNEVWISDAKNDTNKKPLGKVNQAAFTADEETKVKTILDSEAGSDGIYYHIGNRKIVNKTGASLQYNITKGAVPTGNWFSLKDVAENVNFVSGSVFVRKVDDGNSLPSNPIKIFEIAEPINPPKIEVNLDIKDLLYESEDEGYKLLDDNFEYKIGNGDYQNGSLLEKDTSKFGNVTVYVKRKATQKLLASKEINFKFTENISLANVRVNVADSTIEGTTTKMEYRTDENSPWKGASSNKTTINMYKGMNIWIRELDKPSTSTPILENLGNMPEPSADKLEYNISQKYIKNNFTNILEYRINDNPWNTINVGQTINIEFVPARLSIRTKATFDKLASNVVDVIESLDYPKESPIVVPDDDKNTVTSIDTIESSGDWKDYEFKLKTDSEWMPGNNLKTYDLSGDKVVQIRIKSEKDTLPSETAEVIFTKNINLTEVKLRKTTPLTLISTEPEMEYQVYLNGKPMPTTWTKASAGTTTLDSNIKFDDIKLIVIRDSRNKSVHKVVIGDEKNLPVDLSSVSYVIKDSEIEFTGITKRMRYKLSSSTDWVDGTGSDTDTDPSTGVNTGSLKITEITIEDNLYPTITRTISVSERAGTPEVTVSKVDYENNKSKITLDGFEKDNMEYSIDGGVNWKTLTYTGDIIFEITKDQVLVVRAKAVPGKEGEGKLPSLPTKQLNGTSLADVKVDVQNKKLLETTQFMEYSLDSTDGKNGTWKPANDKETTIQIELGVKVYIREIKNTANSRMIGPIGQEPMPDLTSGVYFNISTKKIANFTNQKLEYRVNGKSWNQINEVLEDGSKVAYNVVFEPGPLEFRTAASGSNSASKPTTLTIIKVPGSKPQMAYDDIKDTVTLTNPGDYEYKITIDGISTSWIPGTELEKEDLSGNKKVEIRKKATPKDLPSEIQEIPFTDNLIKRVRLSTHVDPHELNGTTKQMQYRITLNNNTDTGWITCDDGNTVMPTWLKDSIGIKKSFNKLEIRDSKQTKNVVEIELPQP